MRLKLAGRISRESEYYIGARSFMAATRPDIELQPTVNVKTTKALQTGCVHIEQMIDVLGPEKRRRRTYTGKDRYCSAEL